MQQLLEESGASGTSSALVRIDLSKASSPGPELRGGLNDMPTIQELSPAPSMNTDQRSPRTPIHDVRARMEELAAEQVAPKSTVVQPGLSNGSSFVHTGEVTGEITAALQEHGSFKQ